MNKIRTGHLHHGPFQQHNPEGPWWVRGVMYTNDLDVIARCRKSGLSIEPVDTVPDDYTHAVEQMKAEALREVRPAVAPQDGSDRYNYAAGHCASP